MADLDAAVHRSQAHPIVIFKHSATCGTSAFAFEEVEELLEREPGTEVFIVSVQSGAAISREIEHRFALRHQSPQALIVRNGAVVWHASHYRVTQEAMASALAAIGSASA